MFELSRDPKTADRQMRALIFYLTAFGYIDGDFMQDDREFVRDYIEKAVKRRVEQMIPDDDEASHRLVERFTNQFNEVFGRIERTIGELFTESVQTDEPQDEFIRAKLKQRCFEIFLAFDRNAQRTMLKAVNDLVDRNDEPHPAEKKFRDELVGLAEFASTIKIVRPSDPRNLEIRPLQEIETAPSNHDFFTQFEFHYSADPKRLARQISADMNLIDKVLSTLSTQREAGHGKLLGHRKIGEIPKTAPFLDGYVYMHPALADERYEIVVLGDLHGCYSCLKAAVLQSEFLQKVAAYKNDPTGKPKPLLVFLGDYIDRGFFGTHGVLRAAMQIFVSAPDHVVLLRGNHERFLERGDQIVAGVRPAETLTELQERFEIPVLRKYMALFEQLPSMMIFERTMFVHAGIPRDRTVRTELQSLRALNDPDIRFQMMWSDPSSTDIIPAQLQQNVTRFAFGRLQAADFLNRIGCTTLIRGHEKCDDGFRIDYEDDQIALMTLFSSGGIDNNDLPPRSGYRKIEPAALTLEWANGKSTITPWRIDYRSYNDPTRNRFYNDPTD
ncbi:MAG: metallophosphoesterase family protein [Polyangiales bacterium]